MAHRRPPAIALGVVVATAVVLLQGLLVALFVAPSAQPEPHDLPVIVTGPASAAFADQLRNARPDAFDIITKPDEAAADAALRDREAYAAFVVGPGGAALHTASGASPTVAALLTQAAQPAAGGRPVQVVDVVPTDRDDPRGAGFASGFLPLAMTSLAAGAALFLLLRSRVARVTGLVTYAVLAGVVAAAVLQYWLGVLPGDYLFNAAAIALFGLAAAATVTGLGAVLGTPGIGLGALLVFLVANPLSAVNSAPELLPEPWGEVGQWLPVGAGATLLRSAAYFDGAGGGTAAAILAGYAALGLALAFTGRHPTDAHPTPA